MTLPLLQATLDAYKPDSMNEEDASNLELLLNYPAFEPLWSLVESKLEAFYEHLRSHPQYEFNGSTATEKPQAVPPESLKKKESRVGKQPIPVMTFRNVNGLLVPVKA